MTCESLATGDRVGIRPAGQVGAPVGEFAVSVAQRAVSADVFLVAMIAVILGVVVGSVLGGLVDGVAFALVAALAFRVVLRTINPTE